MLQKSKIREKSRKTTIDHAEIEHFSSIAHEWWDPKGMFRPLHQLNPVRLAYIKRKICCAFDRESLYEMPLHDIKILDIGCGGGLLCEPLARLGAEIIGIDPSSTNISVAKMHAQKNGLQIDYRTTSIEEIAKHEEKFDVVLNMEVVEHVSDIDLFISASSNVLKSGGLMFISTINRTWKAWIFAIIFAENILHWLPKGTHCYEKFLRPKELKTKLTTSHLTILDEIGINYNPFLNSWQKSYDMSINYMLLARLLKPSNHLT